MNIVVVESPGKAKPINKYLGSDYKVLASYGHVRDLPAKDGSVRPDEDFEMSETVVTCCAPLGASRLSEAEAQATAALFKALADPARVRIVNVLATSAEPSDDPLADAAGALGVQVVRGPLDDVLGRFVMALDKNSHLKALCVVLMVINVIVFLMVWDYAPPVLGALAVAGFTQYVVQKKNGS